MVARVGVNGFGRIGRAFTRMAKDRADLEVVAVNDIAEAKTLAHLLEFDSAYGRFGNVGFDDHALVVAGKRIAVLSERDPAAIDWAALGADLVVESTGKFRTREAAAAHLKGGARKVLISAPGKGAKASVTASHIRVRAGRRLRPARIAPAAIQRGMRVFRLGRYHGG